MITEKVKEFRRATIAFLDARDEMGNPAHGAGDPEGIYLANRFWDELHDHCEPTKEEFASLTSRILFTPDALYYIWKRK